MCLNYKNYNESFCIGSIYSLKHDDTVVRTLSYQMLFSEKYNPRQKLRTYCLNVTDDENLN